MKQEQHRRSFGNVGAIIGACVFLVGMPLAQAEGAVDAKPLKFRKVMRDLGLNMQAIAGAISQENWTLVAQIAPKVAAHPEPPETEKMRILGYLGTNISKFKSYDGQTHEAAHAMEQAAQRGDGEAVIRAFAQVQESCLGCHRSFRKAFVEHFYGSR